MDQGLHGLVGLSLICSVLISQIRIIRGLWNIGAGSSAKCGNIHPPFSLRSFGDDYDFKASNEYRDRGSPGDLR